MWNDLIYKEEFCMKGEEKFTNESINEVLSSTS